MNLDDVLKLDTKLLVAFCTIMEEGNLSRAAERLNVTQPALSKTLQKLRSTFNDILFTRQAYGLTPTNRAAILYDQIKPILYRLSDIMRPVDLDLKSLKRRFRLQTKEGVLDNFIGPLLSILQEEAPGIRLSITGGTDTDSQLEEVLAGSVDFQIVQIESIPSNVRSEFIGYMELCIIISEASPLYEKETISLSDILSHQVVTNHLPNNTKHSFTNVSLKLKQQGYLIEPTLETDSFMISVEALKQGMTFATLQSTADLISRMLGSMQGECAIRTLPVPEEILQVEQYSNRIPHHLCWSERMHGDLAHRWIRDKILYLMRQSPWVYME